MNTTAIFSTSGTTKRAAFGLMVAAFLVFNFSSCRKGEDGFPGNAFLALRWEVQIPAYLDAGTPDIPPVFQWGIYYPASPGYYTLYYEGDYFNGVALNHYAWEIDYRIWVNPGENGGFGFDGRNGPDSYLNITISPYGPYTDRINKSLTFDTGKYFVIEESDDQIKILQEEGHYSMMITYRKINTSI